MHRFKLTHSVFSKTLSIFYYVFFTGKVKNIKQSQEYETPRNKRFDRLWKRIVESIYIFVDDFTVEPESQSENQDGDPLTVKQLVYIKYCFDHFKLKCFKYQLFHRPS